MSVSNFSTLVNIFKYMSTFWEKKSVQKHFERAFVSNETRRDVVDHVLVSWSTAGPCQIPDYIAWLHREPTILVVISQSICHSKHYLVCFAFVSWCSDSSTTLKHNIPLPLAFVLFKWLHYGKVLRAQSNGPIDDGRGLQTFLRGDGMIKLDVSFQEKSLLSSEAWFGKTQRLRHKTMKWTKSIFCCVRTRYNWSFSIVDYWWILKKPLKQEPWSKLNLI